MRKTFDFTIEWNDSGIPVTSLDRDAYISLSVVSATKKEASDPSLPPQIGSVSISGNRAGLLALAERLIAIAYTDIEGYHEHIDGDCPAGFAAVDGNWELLIERSDIRAIRNAIKLDT